MHKSTRYLGLDVHAETTTAAIAEGRGRIRRAARTVLTRRVREQYGRTHIRASDSLQGRSTGRGIR